MTSILIVLILMIIPYEPHLVIQLIYVDKFYSKRAKIKYYKLFRFSELDVLRLNI